MLGAARVSAVVVLVLLGLGGCAPVPINEGELAAMRGAPKPSSDEAAQRAVKAFFGDALFDAPAARWEFQAPAQNVIAFGLYARPHLDDGYIKAAGGRAAGWFLCGKINGKNRMGGYTGFQPFYVYFSPTTRDTVIDGAIDGGADSTAAATVCAVAYPGVKQ